MLSGVVQCISRLMAERTGTGMEPEHSELGLDERANESDAGQEHLYRLFIGWVPKTFSESDLLPLFQKYGDVKDVIILKDKVSGQPRGCAFVSYGTREEADAAIQALDKGVHLPGALCPIEVRFARSHQYVPAGIGPQDNRQLFIARLPPTATEDELRVLFSHYGEVEEINLFRERRTHISKGCGFVTMGTREQAMAAMFALDEKQLFDGSLVPVAVKWADPDLQLKKRRAVEDSNAENRMLFFAKVLRSANEDEVRGLFSKFGRVVEVNMFRAFQGAPTTKGCGLVTMGSNEEAAAAIQELDSKHVWDGMDAPMVVKWMDAALQRRRKEEHLAAMRQGLVPSMSMGSDAWLSSSRGSSLLSAGSAPPGLLPLAAGLSQGKLLEVAAAAAGRAAGVGAGGVTSLFTNEVPPAGCAPDAYKLFVGNVPKALTEEELRPVFESVGPVVELVVVRDKYTHESKGSAFVWYINKADADRAVMQFNLCRVLSDPNGEQDRPLVVRRANIRKPASALMLPQQALLTANTLSSDSAGGYTNSASLAAMNGLTSMGSIMVQDLTASLSSGGLGGVEVPVQVQPLMTMQVQQQQQQYQPQNAVGTFNSPFAGYHNGPSIEGANSAPNIMLTNSYHSGSIPQPAMQLQGSLLHQQMQQQQQIQQQQQQSPQYMFNSQLAQQQPQVVATGVQLESQSSAGLSGVASGPTVQMSLQLTAAQWNAVSSQLYNIANMSGASISTTPAAGGLFRVSITGAQTQVIAARQLLSTVLGHIA